MDLVAVVAVGQQWLQKYLGALRRWHKLPGHCSASKRDKEASYFRHLGRFLAPNLPFELPTAAPTSHAQQVSPVTRQLGTRRPRLAIGRVTPGSFVLLARLAPRGWHLPGPRWMPGALAANTLATEKLACIELLAQQGGLLLGHHAPALPGILTSSRQAIGCPGRVCVD